MVFGLFVGKWMNLKISILNEMRLEKTNIACLFSFMDPNLHTDTYNKLCVCDMKTEKRLAEGRDPPVQGGRGGGKTRRAWRWMKKEKDTTGLKGNVFMTLSWYAMSSNH